MPSATNATKAGPDEVRAKKASSWASGSSWTSPTRPNKASTQARSALVTLAPKANPVRPARTKDGVLGTARTQCQAGKRRCSRSNLTPANTEISSPCWPALGANAAG